MFEDDTASVLMDFNLGVDVTGQDREARHTQKIIFVGVD